MQTKPIVHMVQDDEVTGSAEQTFERILKRSGKVPKWIRVMANSDDILADFLPLLNSIMKKSSIPEDLRWKVARQVSIINNCKFCIDITHSQLKTLGVADSVLNNIEQASNKKEQIALKFAEAATIKAYDIKKEIIDELKENFTDKEIVELASIVGIFNFINKFNDSLKILPDSV